MSLTDIAIAAAYLLFIPVLWQGGNLFCRVMLNSAPPLPAAPQENQAQETSPPQSESRIAAGRVIGVLERLLIILGIVFARWEIIAGVVALKTVARYKELDTQLNAEYFLIGSLASIFWAVVVAIAFLAFDKMIGFDLAAQAQVLLGLAG